MRSKPTGFVLAAAVALALARASAQEAPAADQQAKVGPYAVPKHWSKYAYPDRVPEGVPYHIIEKGDTLWDLARRYLRNPLLWPQIWDQNKYITDAHWIYPLDPLVLRQVEVVADRAGQAPETTAEVAIEPAPPPPPQGPPPNQLVPATEFVTMQCAPRVVDAREDESLFVVGSEQGSGQVSFADRDILYLSKGGNAGIKPGDLLSIHSKGHALKHPRTGKTVGVKVMTKGWVRVIASEETSAMAVVEQACAEIVAGEYLRPFERVSVPIVVRQPPPDRLTPHSGKAQGYVVDIGAENLAAATGHLLFVDIGSADGVAPGNLMTVYRIEYPKLPSSRHVLGELTVLSVTDKMALALVNYSTTAIETGDSVELR